MTASICSKSWNAPSSDSNTMGYRCVTAEVSGSCAAATTANASPEFAASMPTAMGICHGKPPFDRQRRTRGLENAASAPRSSGGKTFSS